MLWMLAPAGWESEGVADVRLLVMDGLATLESADVIGVLHALNATCRDGSEEGKCGTDDSELGEH